MKEERISAMKWFVYGLTSLFILLVIAGAAIAFMLATLDPNDYKGKIANIVQENTGRVLTLDGPVELTYFPVFGFTVRQASLGNPPEFGGGEFAATEELRAGVKIIPLFSGAVELDSIHAIKPKINMIRLANGRTNMEFSPPGKPAQDEQGEDEEKGPGFSLSTGEIEISEATVIYTDRATGKTVTVDPLNFSLSSFAFAKSSSMDMDAVLKTEAAQIDMDVTADVAFNNETSQVSLKNFAGDFDIQNPNISKNIKVSAKSDSILADLKAQQAQVEKGRVNWEDTAIETAGTFGWGTRKNAQFTLVADTINLDNIIAAMGSKSEAKGVGNTAVRTAEAAELPVDMLRNLSADGTINIGTLKAFGLTMSDMEARVNGNNGVINFDPVKLSLYGGNIVAAGQLNATGNVLRGTEKGSIQGIRIGDMLKDIMGEAYVSGVASADYDVNFAGNTVPAILSRLGGNASLEVGEGSVNHWQLSQRINQAITFFETKRLDENAAQDFRFTSLKGSLQGQNGVFRNSDFVVIGPKSHGLGQGVVNLANKTVDYTIRIGLGDEPAEFAKADHLPVTMSGPFSAPRYGIDVQALIREQAGEKIEEKKQELIGKALDKLGLQPRQQEGAPESQEPASGGDAGSEARKVLENLLGGTR